MHPSRRLKGSTDDRLKGSRIVYCISGSIAAVESVKISRELIRHGGEVIPVMTAAAARIVHPDALRFACGVDPIMELTGDVEHITVFGEELRNIVLVAPATADIISKISLGIADDAATTICLNALGSGVPVVISPAMGMSMMNNPFLVRNMERLRREGVTVLPSFVEENEAKILDATTIVEHVVRTISPGVLRGRHVLVVAGASEEPIDDVRLVSSRSSGRTAVEVATAAFEEKATVSVWCGRVTEHEPLFLNCSPFGSITGLLEKAKGKRFDIVVTPASLADYIPTKKKGKIPSTRESLTVEMHRAPKFIEEVRSRCKVLVAFKAEVGEDKDVIDSARKRLKEARLDIIIANNLSDVTRDRTRAHLITKDAVEHFEGTKRGLAEAIIGKIASMGK